MGLDITAYSGLKEVGPQTAEHRENGNPDGTTTFWDNPDFPGRIDGVKEKTLYSYDEEEHVFGRSYGTYGAWREWLAQLSGYPLTEYEGPLGRPEKAHAAACWHGATGPFSELINFADNEGTIGPVVAAKLAKDFAEWDERAKAAATHGWEYEVYGQIRSGVEMAARNGALDFH